MRRVLRSVWIACGLGFTAWLGLGFQSAGVPELALRDSPAAGVVSGASGIEFKPATLNGPGGLVFLPGGMVDPVAYVPLVRAIAESGYRAHLLYLPVRCACTESQVRTLFDRIDAVVAGSGVRWVLAGHSRGAMLASRYARERSTLLSGLVLIGSTHPRDFSLAFLPIPVIKVLGTRDGIAPVAEARKNQHLLPAAASWVEIAGANHVQFGHYRYQLGDEGATISREEQQRATQRAIGGLLASWATAK